MKLPRPLQHAPASNCGPVATAEPLWSDRFALLLIVVVGGLAYSTALTCVYAYSDDYEALWQALSGRGLVAIFASQGRIVGGWLFTLAILPVQSIEQLWIPRLISICGVIGLALAWYASLRQFGYGSLLPLLAAVLLLLLPTFVIHASWAILCPNIYGALAAVAAFWCVQDAWQESFPKPRLGKAAGGVGLLVVAFNIYQPTAMFYGTMLIAWLLSPAFSNRIASSWRQLGRHLTALVVAMAVSYLVLRVCTQFFEGNSQRTALDLNLLAKVPWFLDQPLFESYFLVFFRRELPGTRLVQDEVIAMLILATALGLYWFLPQESRGRGWRLLGVLLLLPLSYLPNLIVVEPFASFRSRGAIAPAMVLLILCALAGFWRRQRRWRLPQPWGPLLVLALVAVPGIGVVQYHLTRYLAVPCQVEWRTVRQEVAQTLFTAKQLPQEIAFLMPREQMPIPGMYFYDEYGMISCSRPWVPNAMCRLILRELVPHDAEPLRKVPITLVPPSQEPPASSEARWIIDARRVNRLGDRVFTPFP